jgi:N-acetylneuraminic acid mutarotase
MKFIPPFLLLSFLFTLSLWSATSVPYSGKIDIRGVNYFGEAQFAFSLHDGNGTTHWRNGKQPGETIKVTIRNGRYSVLLGGQGMNSLPPELFLNHDKLYLKVEVDMGDGEGLRHLTPDQLITATPRALVADLAKVAEVAKVAQVAEKVSNGVITREMLSSEVLVKLDANGSSVSVGPITRDMLPASVLNDLNKTIVITRDMLPQDVRDDLNKTIVITRDMLPEDVRVDLNKTIVITRDMLPASVLNDLNKSVIITRDMLQQDVRNDLNKSIVITRDMLPASVLNDLNKSVIITRDMLPQDVRDDLNKTLTITRNMLPADVLADLNKSSSSSSPITLSMLAPEVTAKLDQNGSSGNTTVVNPPVVGSTLAVPHGQNAPSGYSLYHQVGQPKELIWEEKAPVSVARYAYDGVEVLGGKIYFVGGAIGSTAKDITERYDPVTNTWETLNSMSVARVGLASAVLNGKLYAIGGTGLSSVEVFDPLNGNWSAGVALPSEVNRGTAITVNNKIYLVGGRNSSDQDINQVLSFDPSVSQWTAKANMPTARHGMKLVWFENRIWAIGGGYASNKTNKVESYAPTTDTWQTEASLTTNRQWPVAWVANRRIYVGGGHNGSLLNSIEFYDSVTKQWSSAGNFPENKFAADAVVLNDKAYVIAGERNSGVYSNKVFAADLNASVAGVYDLYRKDGNASAGTPLVQAEVADGSVTASKIASKTIGKDQISDEILKYLKPEITSQPQANAVYADSNVSFSVTAEGKYLTYQWKKDGSSLTGETNATLTITDANATQHDGNYSVVVSNDFGSVESGEILVDVNTTWSTDGLVGWWKFDETNGTIAYDSSGNGNDGNLTGGPTWATGKIGGALSFDGVDDYVLIPATTDLDLMRLTISTWVYSTNFDHNGFIFEKTADGNVNTQYNLFIQNSELRFRVKPINSSYSDTKVDQSILSGWSFITSSYNSSKRKLFVNGQLVASNDFNETIATNPNGISLIGAYAFNSIGSNYFFNGLIDDVRIYDRALSAEEVQALYNMGQ